MTTTDYESQPGYQAIGFRTARPRFGRAGLANQFSNVGKSDGKRSETDHFLSVIQQLKEKDLVDLLGASSNRLFEDLAGWEEYLKQLLAD
ncbi:MAG: hypothetical protein KDN05_14825 [Verrucomicrobiae bacterium]|nr:hypothetical protein [Verrucomicrobiae bacterium]